MFNRDHRIPHAADNAVALLLSGSLHRFPPRAKPSPTAPRFPMPRSCKSVVQGVVGKAPRRTAAWATRSGPPS